MAGEPAPTKKPPPPVPPKLGQFLTEQEAFLRDLQRLILRLVRHAQPEERKQDGST